jgi:hypothetical protein
VSSDLSHAVTAISTSVLAATTAAALIFSVHQVVDIGFARKAQNYLELRKAFFAIDKDLDNVNRIVAYPEGGHSPEWMALKRYWYFSQTEWKMAQVDPEEKANWENAQKPKVVHSLRELAFCQSFLDMESTHFTDSEGSQFVKEVVVAAIAEHRSAREITASALVVDASDRMSCKNTT